MSRCEIRLQISIKANLQKLGFGKVRPFSAYYEEVRKKFVMICKYPRMRSRRALQYESVRGSAV